MKKNTAVLVTDSHRGIYYGRIAARLEGGNAIRLTGARHCFRYECQGGHEGTYGLASRGPGPGSKIGPVVTMTIRDVATISACTAEAVERWESATWGR